MSKMNPHPPALEVRGPDQALPGLHAQRCILHRSGRFHRRAWVGENGAGKSTTLNAVLGVIHPDAGDIRLYGRRQQSWTGADRAGLGAVLDSGGYPDALTPDALGRVLGEFVPRLAARPLRRAFGAPRPAGRQKAQELFQRHAGQAGAGRSHEPRKPACW